MDFFSLIAGKIMGGGSGSSGVEYTNIVYNEDNTVTLTDKDGIEHTMSCTYENGKLTGVNYDGKAVELTYNGDVLVNVGKAVVDMGNAPATSGIEPLDHTVIFKVDGNPYEIVSVKDGNQINAPANIPTSESGTFGGWLNGETSVTFPLTPTEDLRLNAEFIQTVLPQFYEHFGVSQTSYPYVVIEISPPNNGARLFFSRTIGSDTSGVACSDGVLRILSSTPINISNYEDIAQITNEVMRIYSASDLQSGSSQTFIGSSSNQYIYCNAQVTPPATVIELI